MNAAVFNENNNEKNKTGTLTSVLTNFALLPFRTVRRRKRIPVLVAVEAGQHHPVPLFVHDPGTHKLDGTGPRAAEKDDVRHRAVLHHVVHDERRFRQRRLGNGQRKDFHHLHDGHCV